MEGRIRPLAARGGQVESSEAEWKDSRSWTKSTVKRLAQSEAQPSNWTLIVSETAEPRT